jgi:hypothetical protein
MDIKDERSLLRRMRERRGDDVDDLGDESDDELLDGLEKGGNVRLERQVKETKRRR